MKRSRFSEEQKVRILEEIRSGKSRKEICAEHNVSSQTISLWKRKYGEMDVNEAHKLKPLDDKVFTELENLVFLLGGSKYLRTLNFDNYE